MIAWRPLDVEKHLHVELRLLVHAIGERPEDDVALVDGVPGDEHRFPGVLEHLADHDGGIAIDDPVDLRAGPDKVDQILGHRPLLAILAQDLEEIGQLDRLRIRPRS